MPYSRSRLPQRIGVLYGSEVRPVRSLGPPLPSFWPAIARICSWVPCVPRPGRLAMERRLDTTGRAPHPSPVNARMGRDANMLGGAAVARASVWVGRAPFRFERLSRWFEWAPAGHSMSHVRGQDK
jgi:hypothetical protein